MNDYITLDSKKYSTSFGSWAPSISRPVSVRTLVNSNMDVTFGTAITRQWSGEIRAPVTAASGYGAISDLRTTLEKLQILSFTDHDGNTHNVVVVGGIQERSLVAKWDASSNRFFLPVTLVKTS